MTSVPGSYFSHLLAQVDSASVNSIKEVRHMKPPIWTDSTKNISYKTYSLEDVEDALNEQEQVRLKVQQAYSGSQEIQESRELFGR